MENNQWLFELAPEVAVSTIVRNLSLQTLVLPSSTGDNPKSDLICSILKAIHHHPGIETIRMNTLDHVTLDVMEALGDFLAVNKKVKPLYLPFSVMTNGRMLLLEGGFALNKTLEFLAAPSPDFIFHSKLMSSEYASVTSTDSMEVLTNFIRTNPSLRSIHLEYWYNPADAKLLAGAIAQTTTLKTLTLGGAGALNSDNFPIMQAMEKNRSITTLGIPTSEAILPMLMSNRTVQEYCIANDAPIAIHPVSRALTMGNSALHTVSKMGNNHLPNGDSQWIADSRILDLLAENRRAPRETKRRALCAMFCMEEQGIPLDIMNIITEFIRTDVLALRFCSEAVRSKKRPAVKVL